MKENQEQFVQTKKKKKRKIIFPIIILLILISVVGAVSFADYIDTFITNFNDIESGTVSMSYTESSNIITLNNALPMIDANGKVQNEYFDFSITSNMKLNSSDPDTNVYYDIIIEPLEVDSGYTALTNSQIKVYLENKDNGNVSVSPTLISNLTDIDSNKILLSTSHIHSYETDSITTNYRLRVWIDFDVDSTKWNSETKYEYKFRVNVNGGADALRINATSASCFLFEEDTENNGVRIVDYVCNDSTINQTSTSANNNLVSIMPNSLDKDNATKQLTNKVITDVIIPETVTIALTGSVDQEELLKEENAPARSECATFFTENIYGGTSTDEEGNPTDLYTSFYEMCSGGTFMGALTLEEIMPRLSIFEMYYPGISDLQIFKLFNLPVSTYTVTSIGDFSFQSSDLTSVVIPDSVIIIEEYAFSNNNLTSVIIPDSVTSIEHHAFYHNELTSVILPNSITTIAYNSFSVNYLTDITIPDSVTSIGSSAFAFNNLTEVIIPNSVTSIDNHAFYANNLSSVIINSGSNLNSTSGLGLYRLSFPSSEEDVTYTVDNVQERTYANNPNLTIYNNSGAAFKWYYIILGTNNKTTSDYYFVTGTVTTSSGTINITTGSPS